MQLGPDTWATARARLPDYDRERLSRGIVHIGPGAFARAHLASYTDDILAKDPSWGITGISLNSPATKIALEGQGGLYTLAEAHPDGLRPRVVGAVMDVLNASVDRAPLLAAIADPATRIVTLTVTEKAYSGDMPALLARALEVRAGAGREPVTVMALDNLPGNGAVLARAVRAAAQDPATIDRIATFPSSMVDRITPAMTDATAARIIAATGLKDATPVLTEPFRQWVIEDAFAGPRPPWEDAGAEIVSDVAPYEAMKLRLLNGAHSTMAYLGQMRGHTTVAGAVGDPEFADMLTRTARDEVMRTLTLPRQTLEAYWQSLLTRFANPGIEHRLEQIAQDGSQKVPIRLLAPLDELRAGGAEASRLTRAVAGWMGWLARSFADGTKPSDPRADALAALATGTAEGRVAALCALPDLVPKRLAQDTAWQHSLAQMID